MSNTNTTKVIFNTPKELNPILLTIKETTGSHNHYITFFFARVIENLAKEYATPFIIEEVIASKIKTFIKKIVDELKEKPTKNLPILVQGPGQDSNGQRLGKLFLKEVCCVQNEELLHKDCVLFYKELSAVVEEDIPTETYALYALYSSANQLAVKKNLKLTETLELFANFCALDFYKEFHYDTAFQTDTTPLSHESYIFELFRFLASTK